MFVAAYPPPPAVEDLDAFWDVRRAAGDFRWSLPDQLHLTLAFLPDVADHRMEDLVERLASAAARRTPTGVRLSGGGALPNAARGRVLYTGVELDQAGHHELDALARGARNAGVASGLTVDGRRFRPHLTVARCGRPTELSSWVRLADSYRGPAWTLDTVTLVASHLGEGPRKRPRHEPVAELRLG